MQDTKPYHFKPNEVANMTGASVQTVRRWTDLFAEFLSDSANAAPGTPRLYTWADVDMIKQVKALRDQNVPVELIPEKLSRPTTSSSTVTHEIFPLTDQEGQHLTPASIVSHDYLIAIERRLEAVEAGRKDFVQGIALGFIGAGVLFILLIGLAVLYGK